MLRMVARDRAIAVTTPARDPEMKAMSAASIATSVPVPMARPTSAAARAGASLIRIGQVTFGPLDAESPLPARRQGAAHRCNPIVGALRTLKIRP